MCYTTIQFSAYQLRQITLFFIAKARLKICAIFVSFERLKTNVGDFIHPSFEIFRLPAITFSSISSKINFYNENKLML